MSSIFNVTDIYGNIVYPGAGTGGGGGSSGASPEQVNQINQNAVDIATHVDDTSVHHLIADTGPNSNSATHLFSNMRTQEYVAESLAPIMAGVEGHVTDATIHHQIVDDITATNGYSSTHLFSNKGTQDYVTTVLGGTITPIVTGFGEHVNNTSIHFPVDDEEKADPDVLWSSFKVNNLVYTTKQTRVAIDGSSTMEGTLHLGGYPIGEVSSITSNLYIHPDLTTIPVPNVFGGFHAYYTRGDGNLYQSESSGAEAIIPKIDDVTLPARADAVYSAAKTYEIVDNATILNATTLYNFIITKGQANGLCPLNDSGTVDNTYLYDQSLNTTDNVSFVNMTTSGTVSTNADLFIKNTAGNPPNVANWGTIRNEAGVLRFNYGGVISVLNASLGYTFNSFSNGQTAATANSYNYYFADVAPYAMTITTITLLAGTGGSDSVRVALFSDVAPGGGLLLGQSNAIGSLTTGAYKDFPLIAPVSIDKGSRFTLAVAIGGSTTTLQGSTVNTGFDTLSWFNTTDSASGGFGTVGVSTMQTKGGNSTWRACAVFA